MDFITTTVNRIIESIDFDRAVRISRICACTGWLLLHRVLINRGFVFRRKGLSTDTRASLIIGSLSTVWFTSTVLLAYKTWVDLQSLQYNHWTLITRSLVVLNAGPLLVQFLFVFWIISWIDGWVAERDARRKSHLWSLIRLRGPFDWASGIHTGYYLALVLTITFAIVPCAAAAIFYGEPGQGVLSLAGLLVFLLNGTVDNGYVWAPHRYADDYLRIALPTSHHEGTVYVLPSKNRGIDAVWTPKVAAENLEADAEIMDLFQQMRSGRWSAHLPLERLRRTLAAYQKRVLLSVEQAERLATWIYADKPIDDASVRTILCERAPNTHLIGRDLMYALCHAEYLVFMAQGRLSHSTRSKLGRLRLMSRSGAGSSEDGPVETLGFRAGYAGYKEAAEHVYSIFNLPIDETALDFSSTQPPAYSAALQKQVNSIDDYVAELWNLSIQNTESTFSALYFFTTVWFMELGNVNAFHIFPLRCKTRDGDLVSQLIAWRQAWFSGLVAQLVTSSQILFLVFVAGYLE